MRETRVTRQELYALLWSWPMQILGPRFGMSDAALEKIWPCARGRTPRP